MVKKLVLYLVLGLIVYLCVSILRHPAPECSENLKTKALSWIALTLWDIGYKGSLWGLWSSVTGARVTSDLLKSKQYIVKDEYTEIAGVPVVIYYPNNRTGSDIGMVNYHGGGFTKVQADTLAPSLARYAEELGAVVVSVEYPRRPEASIAELYDACYKVTKYFIEQSHQWGVDNKRIALIGESAGSTIAAVLSILLRDGGVKPAPKLQVLLYGFYQFIDISLPSNQQNIEGPILHEQNTYYLFNNFITGEPDNLEYYNIVASNRITPLAVREKFRAYVNHDIIPAEQRYPPYTPPVYVEGDREYWNKFGDVITDCRVSPLLTDDLSGLPEAYVVSGQYDILRDDSFLYAKRLRDEGNVVTHSHNNIGYHAHVHAFKLLDSAEYAMKLLIEFMKSRL